MTAQKNRICLVANKPYPNNTFLRQQSEILARSGWEVDVFCTRFAGQSKSEHIEHINIYRIITEAPHKLGFFKYILNSMQFIFMSLLKIQKFSSQIPYRLIIFHALPEYLILAGILQKMKSTKLILHLWDLSLDLFQSRWKRSVGPMYLFLNWAEKLSCKLADHLVTANDGFRENLIKRGVPAEKITVIYNTAHPDIFKFDDNRRFPPIKKGVKLIYHGTVARRFGVINAVNALSKIRRKLPESVLYIYGKYDPDYKEEIKQRISELDLTDYIFLNERRRLEEIYKLIQEADIGIVPYRNDTFMNLALSTKTFEYVAAGIPVVASRMKSTMRLFNENCITYFEPDSEDDFVEKILLLCKDPELRKKRVYSAAEAFVPYSGDNMYKRLINLVEHLSNNHSL